MDEWICVSVSSLSRSSHSVSATTSSSSPLSSSSSLLVSSPCSRARSFYCFFLLSSSFAFRYRSTVARLAAVMAGSFDNRARRSIRTSFFGWFPYLNISVKRSGVQLKRRHEERKLTKTMYPGSGRIGGCPSTRYTKLRIVPTSSHGGSIASLMRCATSEGESAPSTSVVPSSDTQVPSCVGEAHASSAAPPSTCGKRR